MAKWVELEACPPVIRDWILSRVTSEDDITDLHFDREILPDGYENGWAKQKPGPHMIVTVVQNMRVDRQRFVKDDVNIWAIKENPSTVTWKEQSHGRETENEYTERSTLEGE